MSRASSLRKKLRCKTNLGKDSVDSDCLPARFRVSADEEAVVGVCGRHAGDADARLSKHVVDRQSHDVLWENKLCKMLVHFLKL